jgi:ADP-heptose:LPS heptosyltransferase
VEILVLHPGALGDIILSLPALRILRDRFKDARITLAANTDFAITAASGYVHRIVSLAIFPLQRLHSSEAVSPEDKMLWCSYDRIVSWTGFGAEAFGKKFAELHDCVLLAAWKPGTCERRHVARLFVDSLRPWLQVPQVIPIPEIRLDSADRRRGSEWLQGQGWLSEKPLIAIHPGAGSAVKRWPLRRFLELADKLRASGSLLVIEGPAETGLDREQVRVLGAGTYLASNLPLPLLAGILSHCRSFVGNDSGIAHLAAALRIPCVVLFGPTAPEHWAPLGSHVSVLHDTKNCVVCTHGLEGRHACMENIRLDDVLAQALRNLSFTPRIAECPGKT